MEKQKLAAIRCTVLTLLVLGAFALVPTATLAGTTACPPGAPVLAPGGNHTTGLPSTKSCPATANSGTSYSCTFTVANKDIHHCVENLTVTETSPLAGTPVAVQCFQGATAVTVLGWSGSGTESCGGTIHVTAQQNCSGVNQHNLDQIDASATDADPGQFHGLLSSSFAPRDVLVPPLVCNDNSACTTDTCDPATGCVFTPINCDDGLFCTDDSCNPATGCVHTAHDCADNDVCTDDSCNEDTNACDHVFDPTNDPSCAPSAPGRMTGGGSVFTSASGRVTHGFELHCDVEVGPNNLEVNWGPGNHFHMEDLISAVCTDDPNIEPPPPAADFDTYVGHGTGRCNGVAGATIDFTFTDAGEPGKNDTATINITGCPGGLTLSVSGNLNKGNHQAHKN